MAREFIVITNSDGTWQGLYDGFGNLQFEGEQISWQDALGVAGQPFKELTRDEAWLEQYGGRMPQTFDETKDVLGGLQAQLESVNQERTRLAAQADTIKAEIDRLKGRAQTVKP